MRLYKVALLMVGSATGCVAGTELLTPGHLPEDASISGSSTDDGGALAGDAQPREAGYALDLSFDGDASELDAGMHPPIPIVSCNTVGDCSNVAGLPSVMACEEAQLMEAYSCTNGQCIWT